MINDVFACSKSVFVRAQAQFAFQVVKFVGFHYFVVDLPSFLLLYFHIAYLGRVQLLEISYEYVFGFLSLK